MAEGHAISKFHSLCLAGLVSASYVLSVYLSLFIAKPKPPLWRNDPKVIKARCLLASLSTLASCGIVYFTVRGLHNVEPKAITDTLDLLGISLAPPQLLAYLIVPALFLGPLYATFLGKSLPFQQDWDFEGDFKLRFMTWEGFRNYAMAPTTEEVTYRACLLSVYKLAGYSKNMMIWFAPCWFGLAHIHHATETYKRLGRTSAALRTALISTLFQFAYTTIFGWLCSFLFLRTGSIIVPISAHIFCNIMGFPAITWELRQFPSHRTSIILTYVAGVALFCYVLFPWSFNPRSIYWNTFQRQGVLFSRPSVRHGFGEVQSSLRWWRQR